MTLTRRALLVIFPVVLVSNLLVALSVYWVQRALIEDSEATRFAARMGRLSDSIEGDLDFARNIVFSMMTGEIVRDFVREKNREFQVTGLGARLQDGIGYFSGQTNRYVSFAILGPDAAANYYFENSDDPFAEIRPEQVDVAARLLAGPDAASDEYVATSDGGLIIHSQLVDRRTFEAPLARQREHAYVVQSAVKPKEFARLLQGIEADYGTKVTLVPGPSQPSDRFSYAEPIMPKLSLQARLPDAYLVRSLGPLKMILAGGGIMLSLLSVGLLVCLIRRTVTGPIARLDREVKEVVNGTRECLGAPRMSGEIGRLSQNIKAMQEETMKAFRRVQQMSWTDSLTGIANRPRFNLVGQAWIAASNEGRSPLSLLFMDLDHFKTVNDTFGHAAGDAVLRAFADGVCNILETRRNDGAEALLARLAGDEFAILLTADEALAVELAAAIVALFADGLEADGRTYPVTASIGIATAPDGVFAFDELISCADVAMYHAKAAGRDGYAVFSPSLSVLARAS